jgi:DNA-binding GntR family transcriptional regulator
MPPLRTRRPVAAHPATAPATIPRQSGERSAARADLLAHTLATEIVSGNHAVGAWLPDEAALGDTHGATTATVRAALRRLEALGLIVRGSGGRAQVTSAEVRAIYEVGAPDGGGGRYVGETSVLVERRRRLASNAEIAGLLNVREGSQWLHLTGLRLAGDADLGALSWVDAWLGGSIEAAAECLDLSPDALEGLLGTAIVDVHEEVSAAPLTPAQARRLRARSGDGALHIMRRYRRSGGGLVAAVLDVHPAGRVSVVLRAKRPAA